MILVVSRSKGLAQTVCEILKTMGYITECVTPEEALVRLERRHRGVLVLGRNLYADIGELVAGLRRLGGDVPIFAVRDDFDPVNYRIFDRVYANSVYSSAIVEDFISLAVERGLTPIGEYRLLGIDATVGSGRVEFLGCPISLTKTEITVVRYLIATYPHCSRATDVLSFAFKPSRRPTEAGVRTHISAINRKAVAATGEPLIIQGDAGYTLPCRFCGALTV